MLTKSKYYFSIPVIFILLIMQSISYHIRYLQHINKHENVSKYTTINRYLNVSVIMIIIMGFLHFISINSKNIKLNTIQKIILTKC